MAKKLLPSWLSFSTKPETRYLNSDWSVLSKNKTEKKKNSDLDRYICAVIINRDGELKTCQWREQTADFTDDFILSYLNKKNKHISESSQKSIIRISENFALVNVSNASRATQGLTIKKFGLPKTGQVTSHHHESHEEVKKNETINGSKRNTTHPYPQHQIKENEYKELVKPFTLDDSSDYSSSSEEEDYELKECQGDVCYTNKIKERTKEPTKAHNFQKNLAGGLSKKKIEEDEGTEESSSSDEEEFSEEYQPSEEEEERRIRTYYPEIKRDNITMNVDFDDYLQDIDESDSEEEEEEEEYRQEEEEEQEYRQEEEEEHDYEPADKKTLLAEKEEILSILAFLEVSDSPDKYSIIEEKRKQLKDIERKLEG